MATNLMQMLAEGPVLGDGGMCLEANWRGYDVPGIIEHPDALRQRVRCTYRRWRGHWVSDESQA